MGEQRTPPVFLPSNERTNVDRATKRVLPLLLSPAIPNNPPTRLSLSVLRFHQKDELPRSHGTLFNVKIGTRVEYVN